MEHKITHVKSGTSWESKYAYARAKQIGPLIEVAGTTASDTNGPLFPGDHKQQTKYILDKMEAALHELGASKHDVIRTRMYVTDASIADEVASIHGVFFAGIDPASTLLVVKSLLDPSMLVEIEMSAYK